MKRMTNQEVIHILTDIQHRTSMRTKRDIEDYKALEIAINRLSNFEKINEQVQKYGRCMLKAAWYVNKFEGKQYREEQE